MAIRQFLSMSLLLAGAALSAQQTSGWKVGAALPYALDELQSVTGQRLGGLCLDGAYQGAYEGSNAFWRVGLGVNVFPGKEVDGVKRSLTGTQLAFDGVKPLGASRTSAIFGISLNGWSVKGTGTDRWGRTNDVSRSLTLSRLGFRLGIEHHFTDRWAFTALLQVAELGTDNEFLQVHPDELAKTSNLLQNGHPTRGRSGVNPSWIQVGIRYSL